MDTRVTETSRRNTVLIIHVYVQLLVALPYRATSSVSSSCCSWVKPTRLGFRPDLLTILCVLEWKMHFEKEVFAVISLGDCNKCWLICSVFLIWVAVTSALSLWHKHYLFYKNRFVVVKLLIYLALLYQDISFEIWLGSSHRLLTK